MSRADEAHTEIKSEKDRSKSGRWRWHLVSAPGDAVLIERGTPRWLLLACPCGCGAELPINLDRRAGKAWRVYKHGTTTLSVYPSVWRDTDCGSHFIIWRGNILLF